MDLVGEQSASGVENFLVLGRGSWIGSHIVAEGFFVFVVKTVVHVMVKGIRFNVKYLSSTSRLCSK